MDREPPARNELPFLSILLPLRAGGPAAARPRARQLAYAQTPRPLPSLASRAALTFRTHTHDAEPPNLSLDRPGPGAVAQLRSLAQGLRPEVIGRDGSRHSERRARSPHSKTRSRSRTSPASGAAGTRSSNGSGRRASAKRSTRGCRTIRVRTDVLDLGYQHAGRHVHPRRSAQVSEGQRAAASRYGS